MSDKNVMVVEDNEKNRKLMRVVLKAKGYNIIEATTGEKGIKLLTKKKKKNTIHNHTHSSHPRKKKN